MSKIAVLGSTGSIGIQAVDILKDNELGLVADTLVAHSNTTLLLEQVKMLDPKNVGIIDSLAATPEVLAMLKGRNVAVGEDAYDLCRYADTILYCLVGTDGIKALDKFITSGNRIALANKECLVSAGEILMGKAQEGQILPVDSEHSAIWQCLRMGKRSDVAEIILTASGGRYYNYSSEELKRISYGEAVRHPNWRMGEKISVDSATMMNKALEIIEARWLFSTKKIDYVVHPESIIHSLVRFADGSLAAQMSLPNMKLPISAALAYPNRVKGAVADFDFSKPLTFINKREDVFFAPSLARFCLDKGGSSGAVLDGANEGAVRLFKEGKIAFTDIAEIVRDRLAKAEILKNASLDDIIMQHNEIRDKVLRIKEKA